MTELVLDTSVAVAWYLPEVFSASAREWQDRMLSRAVRLWVPLLHYWEMANVLRTYVRRGEISERLAREIMDLHLGAPLEIVEPVPGRVLEVALEYEATAYDSVYIALSLDRDLRLLTAEKTTTPWVVRLGERVSSVR